MCADETFKALNERAWDCIHAKDFQQAEVYVRRLIEAEEREPGEPDRLWGLLGFLANILGSLLRFDEATEIRRQQLAEARQRALPESAVRVSRYMLANQLLLHGEPQEALAEAEPVPEGSGHVQCLLHSVAAQAFWKLSRCEEAVEAAPKALETSPTEDRRTELAQQLVHILDAN
jgi:tetratricopeptide (TPR) repeat protein